MSINKENVKDIKLIDKIVDGTQPITYDNTNSGLSATNLAEAIDEVKAMADVPAQVVTSLTLVGNTLTYLDENLNQTNINLGQYLDNTDKFVVSGSASGGTLTLNLNDASQVNIDVSSLLDNTDKFVVSGAVSQDTLTLSLNDGSTVSINIAGIQNTSVNTNTISFNTNYVQTGLEPVGTLSWNQQDETLDLVVPGGSIYQISQEEGIVARNLSGTTLVNGSVVRITGASGNKATVDLADCTTELGSSATFGVCTQTIPDNSTGRVTTTGLVRGLNTLAYAEGAAIWLNSNGQFSATKPAAPNHLVHIGWVVRSHATEGMILVKISNGWELNELHDVLITNISDGHLIQWNDTLKVWENKDLASMPVFVNALALKANLSGAAFTGNVSTTGSLTVGTDIITSATTANIAGTSTTVNIGASSTTTNIGASANGTTTIGNHLVVIGDLTVQGDKIINNTSTMEVEDTMIYIGTGNTGNSNDIGFVGHINPGTYQHTGLVRDASDNTWKLFSGVTTEPSASTLDFSSAIYDALVVGGLTASSGDFSGNLNVTGTINRSPVITLGGDLTGSVTLTNLQSGTLTATIAPDSVALGTDTTGNYMVNVAAGTGVSVSHTQGEGSTATVSIGQSVATTATPTFAGLSSAGGITPSANASYDLGSSTLAWRNVYTNDLHLSNEGHEEGNSVDGTKGNWTIQEGATDLFIINNKTGKKYKFALEEIQ